MLLLAGGRSAPELFLLVVLACGTFDLQEKILDVCFNLVEFHDVVLEVNPIGCDSSLSFTFCNLFKSWRPYVLLPRLPADAFLPLVGCKTATVERNVCPNTCWFLLKV